MIDGAPDAERPLEAAHRAPTTILLALAAIGAALIAMFGEDDSFTTLSMVSALAGLVPWALLAGGVRIPTWLFASARAWPRRHRSCSSIRPSAGCSR